MIDRNLKRENVEICFFPARFSSLILVLAAAAVWLGMLSPAHANNSEQEVIWFDGSRGPEPEGRLLSDNEFYWGDVVRTGVEYHYKTEPDSPADNPLIDRREGKPGRRLQNGVRESHSTRRHPVGIRNEPLAVVFDFKDAFEFTDVSVSTPTGSADIDISVREYPESSWTNVYQQSLKDSGEGPLHRIVLEERPRGTQMRISIEAEGELTRSDGIWIWGEPLDDEEFEETIRPIAETHQPVGYTFQSIQGIGRSAFSDTQFWQWLDSMGWKEIEPEVPAVWSQVSTWGEISNRSILPNADARIETFELLMSRNETEAAAAALTNTSRREPFEAVVELSGFRCTDTGEEAAGVNGELRVLGATNTRFYGTVLVPMFSSDNMLGRSLMSRYLTNAGTIVEFPRLRLPPAGSAVMWLSVTTEDASPGIYEAQIHLDEGPAQAVRVEVVDVTLPNPFVFVWSCSERTHMHPYEYPDRVQRDVEYKQGLGITVWYFRRGTHWRNDVARQALQTGAHTMLSITHGSVGGASRGRLQSIEDLSESDRQDIAERVEAIVERAEEFGLDYEDWYMRLWDEPGMGNAHSFGVLARYIKEHVNPDVQISMNPCFWAGGRVKRLEYQKEIYEALVDWYNDYIDISIPLVLMLGEDSPLMDLFVADRPVNASYSVSTHHARSECPDRIGFYRKKPWQAFSHGMNGWGFYSWHRPRGNPWNDHAAPPDYQMVYPGPRGAIPTRASEALRQGWEEYRLLTLLREQGRDKLVEELIAAYRDGEDMDVLRERALRAAAPMQQRN